MSSVGLNSTSDALATPAPVESSRRHGRSIPLTGQGYVVLAIAVMIVAGLGMRLSGLGSVGFSEDEINKLEAVHAYQRGDFSVNAEHPMLMKLAMTFSTAGARAINSAAGTHVTEEAALRFPNVLVGALTAIPLFLLTAALFDRRVALWAAAFWAFGVNAITYNRIGKEDTFMVFFMLFAFYFFIRAKQVDTRDKRVSRFRNLSAAAFGLMLASKYFPHYFGLNMLFHHRTHLRQRAADEPRFVTPFSFFIVMGVVFLIANPGLLLPSVWQHLNAYSAEKLLQHSGYIMGDTIYHNRMSDSPFWGLPVYFYLLFMAVKVPLTVLAAFVIGLIVATKSYKHPGHRFVLFMFLFWIVPYSLIGAKWLRYTLSLMPFVYMGAAVGANVLAESLRSILSKLKLAGEGVAVTATAALFLALIAVPAATAYASAPHFALYTNAAAGRYTAWFFPHDEFYDDGANQAIKFITEHAPANAAVASEIPGVVRYYTAKYGRPDLRSYILSDPKYTPATDPPTYVILQKGRTYFENHQEMNEVKARFVLVYAGCIKGHTAAEVYAAPVEGSSAAQPCGDVRP